MTIRTHVPLPVRLGVAIVALSVAVGVGAWLSASGLADARARDDRATVTRLRDENETLRTERDRLREARTSTIADSSAVMESSTLKELAQQVARLEGENAKLKEDVAFFEAATADPDKSTVATGGIAIRRFQVTQDQGAHAARYRILLTQDSRANREFTGELQLVLSVLRNGKAVTIVVPDPAGASFAPGAATDPAKAVIADGAPTQFRVVFRSYKRMEGSFRMPADVSLKSVQARVLERGTVRAQQTVPVG